MQANEAASRPLTHGMGLVVGGGGEEKLSPHVWLISRGIIYTMTFCQRYITDQNKGFSISFFKVDLFVLKNNFLRPVSK